MSEALDYLLKARPEALGHYFAFVKDAGKHLDPKTRNLISVITKVHAQTDRGFRQYLGRALREGCTPVEVLDALLMAFPALGLAKIIWAVDIILTLDIPEFRLDALSQAGQWRDLLAGSDIASGETRRIECDGRGLFVHRDKKSLRVYDSRCPHQSTNIPHLALQGNTLTCPKHQWAFDLASGECIAKGNTGLRRYESRLLKGRLQAFW
jgi:nitrite reductase/ring-hydroxylating ferredoxin subunit/alkylhydroperoxidase/carboxymuconolactone decarboxylase family protein YurZ